MKVSSDICPDCQREIEEDFEKVKNYLKEHPNAKIMKIIDDTGVSESRLNRFIRAGRLSIKPICESCGKPIESGRLCAECKMKLLSEIKSSIGLEEKGKEEEDAFLLAYLRKKRERK
jgi:ribosomal protein L32